MLFAVDIGNTNITFGLFEGDELKLKFRINTDIKRTEDEFTPFVSSILANNSLDMKCIKKVAVSCVVPAALPSFMRFISKVFSIEPYVINSKNHNLHIAIKSPDSLGTDLIANSLSVWRLYGESCLVIDFGTATTFMITEVEDGKLTFIGGSIAPGIAVFNSYLGKSAAQLPELTFAKTDVACGKDTISAMRSGIYFGYLGMVKNITHQIKLQHGKPLKTVITGGFSNLDILHDLGVDIINPNLTLIGIKEFFKLQKP